MPYRTRTRRVVRARKRAVWVNIPFGGVAFSESVGNQLLLVPEDWEASFTGLTNERAVLRAIVGELVFTQTTLGTLGNNFFWGIYAAGIDKAAPVFTVAGMSDVSWLRTGARACTNSVSTSNTSASILNSQPIEIAAKRKLDTNTQISICAQYGADGAANPAGMLSGILRFLVARD